MEIIRQRHDGEEAEVKVRGRLDAYSADHAAAELDELVRAGAHRLSVDCSEVTYLSSVGIGLLLRLHRELKGLGGAFRVHSPSEPVREVLGLAKLLPLLVGPPPEQRGRNTETWEGRAPRRAQMHERNGVAYEAFVYEGEHCLRCRTLGNPSLLDGGRFTADSCPAVVLPSNAYALGVGALGQDYADCQVRFGEFLAAAGVAAYLPTDGTNVPDYLALGDNASPYVHLCYGLAFEGTFARLTRFEVLRDRAAVGLTELIETAFEQVGADAIGMLLVAESAGLMGASMHRSPAREDTPDARFRHPHVRTWLSITGEHVYREATALIVGVAQRAEPRGRPGPSLTPWLRPLGVTDSPIGHFHAAVFSQRTLPKGEIEVQPTVARLFEHQRLQTILHLLGDYRETTGMGESELLRGACWVGPITDIVPEGISE
jgi:anti-anti-sigma factor